MVKLNFVIPVLLFALSAIPKVFTVVPLPGVTRIISELLIDDSEKKFAIAPNLIFENLWQLYLGADAKTSKALGRLLHSKNLTKEKATKEFKLRQGGTEGTKYSKMYTGNNIFISSKFNILQSYTEETSEIFDHDITRIDFKDPEDALKEINTLFAKQTKSKVNKILKKIRDSDTRMMIINAQIFNEPTWKYPFNAKTKKWAFLKPYMDGIVPVVINMLTVTAPFRQKYIIKMDADIINMPFAEKGLTMLLFRPRQVNGLQKAIRNLKLYTLDDLTPTKVDKEIRVIMPRFKIDAEVDLQPKLIDLGLKTLTENANMGSLTDSHDNIQLGSYIHKTIIQMENKNNPPAPPEDQNARPINPPPHVETMIFDHPFLFMVTDQTKIYFAGYINSPGKNIKKKTDFNRMN